MEERKKNLAPKAKKALKERPKADSGDDSGPLGGADLGAADLGAIKGAQTGPDGLVRCPWALADPLSRAYHDARWGRPCHDDGELFKTLVLEGMQAGLSWSLILKKESEILSAFEGLDPKKVAAFGAEKVDELMKNPGIIRNRLKINAAITNAKLFLALAQEKGSFSNHVWSFVESKPIVNNFREMAELPATTEISDRISRDLKKRGFKFIGSTIIYSFMQAMGLVNDHLVDCAFRFPEGQG